MTESNTTELAAVAAAEPLSIKEAVLAQFKAAEVTITGLAEKYRNVAYDVATTKGMKEAIAARADLRDNGRLFVTKSEERVRGEVNDTKRVMASELVRLVAIIKPVEDHVDAQIKAEETRKAEEKAKREQAEAERVAGHIAKINGIKAAADKAKGILSDRITNGIALVEAMTFGDDCEEFKPQYEAAKAETLEAMRTHLADAKAREAAELQRLENERVARELAEQALQLAEQAAELKRQQAEALAARVALTHAVVFAFPEPEPIKTTEAQPTQQVLKATPAMAEATDRVVAVIASPSVGSMGAGQAADAAPAGDVAPASVLINTAELCALVGLDLSTAEIQGFGLESHPTPAGKRGTFWDAADADALTDALVSHLLDRKAERNK